MSTPKQINVPTVLLDAVCKATLKKSKKPVTPSIQVNVKAPVIYKMISTDEWLKQQEAKKAVEARIQAFRQSPKLEATIKQAIYKPRQIKQIKEPKRIKQPKQTNEQRKQYFREYYFKNKERYQLHAKKHYLKLKKAKIDPFNELPQP